LAALESAGAQTTASSPSPAATGSAKPPSASALATAQDMRRFDPALTDADIVAIAAGIDANRDAAGVLDPKKKRLANADEPALHFAALPIAE
jgi:hypothetical protein